MQYTCLDLIYTTSRLYSYAAAPSIPAFQGIKHLILYRTCLHHCPIIYPSVIYGTKTHELCQEVSPGNYHSKNTPISLFAFADGGEGCTLNKKHAIASIIFCLFGVAVH